MVKRNCSLPFSFYCLTEDSTDLYPEINTIPLDMSLDLEGAWWKMCLFNVDLAGPTLYFDLDVIVQNNINQLFTKIVEDKLIVLRTADHGSHYPYDGSPDNILTVPQSLCNSSLMGWFPEHFKHIYNNFIKDPDTIMTLYYGDDRLLSKDYYDDLAFWNMQTDFYWRNKGVDHYDQRFIDCYGWIKDPRKTICILSNAHPEHYVGMEDYFL